MDRGKPGSKMHVLSDANGLPLRVGLSAANTHDSLVRKPMLSHFHMGHEFHATIPSLGVFTWTRHTTSLTCGDGCGASTSASASPAKASTPASGSAAAGGSSKALTGYRRLNQRYEHHSRNYLAFLGLASALCCYKRFLKTDHVGHGLSAAIRPLWQPKRSAVGPRARPSRSVAGQAPCIKPAVDMGPQAMRGAEA